MTSGHVASGYEPVAEAFEQNFSEREELGAAFAAVVDGHTVVDLWGGLADRDRNRPWQEDTLQVIFSGTKGLVALCMLILIERGQLDLDAAVARYWPEFATGGKNDTLVSHVVSHRAGLPGIRAPITVEDVANDRLMGQLLAGQEPFWPAGEEICYHALTYGWLCGEIVRRVDGRSIGHFFADEIAGPLGLEVWIGLPPELEPRVSVLERRVSGQPLYYGDCDSEIAWAVSENPRLFDIEPAMWNTSAYHQAEIPGAGAIGTARSLARLYACLAAGGELDGVRLLRPETVRLGRTCLARGSDRCSGEPLAFGVGFMLQTEMQDMGPSEDAFGHGGAGGSIHAADPGLRLGFSYAMNEMRDDPARAQSLLAALYAALRSSGETPV